MIAILGSFDPGVHELQSFPSASLEKHPVNPLPKSA
jgi:hypothetical protein